jgi:hypothetical protein
MEQTLVPTAGRREGKAGVMFLSKDQLRLF